MCGHQLLQVHKTVTLLFKLYGRSVKRRWNGFSITVLQQIKEKYGARREGLTGENETYGKKGMKNCFSSSHSIFPLMMSLMSITTKERKKLCLWWENSRKALYSYMSYEFPLCQTGKIHTKLEWKQYPLIVVSSYKNIKTSVSQCGL